ncbi:serine protease inhibitor 88Ea [Halyomorpha halys]|uniref:serine protease inhibitor 88Ea n=1 Tax=Halyomorpha halys TaxID=286706 RepID=UPI0006D50DB4|nr:serine protease inhibitor 88Ea-like [Halyomorpha halys]
MKMLLLLFLVPTAVLGQCLTSEDSKLIDPAWPILYKGQQLFSLNMLNIANNVTPSENILFSPFSVYNALILAYFTANNHTEQVLKKALYIPPSQSKDSTMKAYALQKRLRAPNNGSSEFELLSANRLFVSNKLTVRQCMLDLFKEEIVNTDFAGDPKAALKMINDWVAEKTKDQIKNLLSPEQVNEATQLVLANAAYFKGWWKSKFQPESTSKELFYISNSQNAFVMMMKQKSTFNHLVSEKLNAHVLELPYKGDEISLIILLPPFASPNGVTNILRRLKTHPDLNKMINEEMMQRPVEVSIPKFSIEQELQLLPILNSMDIGELFTSSADLSGLTGHPELKLDDIVHKAKITLDEEGTTASAATAIFNFRSSRPLDPAKFICNHPFVYILFDKKTSTLLFTGIYYKPPPS